MNKVVLIGRLTKDPEVRYTGEGEQQRAFCRYTLAVDRRFRRDNEQQADFISCVAFGKGAEFVEKYFRKGSKIGVCGRIQTGSYTNREGQKVYTTDVVAEEHYFVEKRADAGQTQQTGQAPAASADDGFINIPDGVDDELPFV